MIDRVIIEENIKYGERVRAFQLEVLKNGHWIEIGKGQSIGHKRIQKFDPVSCTAIRLVVEESRDVPQIANFSVYTVK